MERSAWFCPSCQRHHAPHVETCPNGSRLTTDPKPGFFDPNPVKYWPTDGTFNPCAGCKGPCSNAACPKRIQITSTGAWS